MAVLCVIQDSHFVIIEVNLVDKGIHQSLTVFQVIYIALAKRVQEEAHFIDCGRGMGRSFHKNLLFQLIVFPFLLGDTLRNHIDDLAALKGLKKIFCGPLVLF
ncbi:hypothetical protein NE626_10735 [Intestinimonas massiliensis]|uniref:hypothetical protein n=1 Tax=Intestinimonas massiliensis (ex Afouda et al. 2020) TaxID=1673721 RepID=UPI00210A32BC|nr:hypothetical protein [Intestinimonas massiliensis (ex Afouda et al. 2020)]MCQ4807297.1 hypothetical protein [Intestinimonas massiliensis (ex Afouda et al. 2020)]